MLTLLGATRPSVRFAPPRRARRPGPTVSATEACMLILLASSLAGCAATGWFLTRPPGPVAMPQAAGPRTLKGPLEIALAIDDSGSMQGSNGNDPLDRRATDAALLVSWAARHAARRGDTIAIASFASTLLPGARVPLLSAGPALISTMSHTSGGTSFGPVADWASQQLPPVAHGARLAIVVTDGKAGDAGTSAVQLAHSADRVLVVQLARHGAKDAAKAFTVPGVKVVNATTKRPQAVAAAIAHEILETTGQGVR